ncbi:MAG: hypothetical protein RSE62_03570 [Citrobacter sp.]
MNQNKEIVDLTNQSTAAHAAISFAAAKDAMAILSATTDADSQSIHFSLLEKYFAQECAAVADYNHPLRQIQAALRSNYDMGFCPSPGTLIFSEEHSIESYIEEQIIQTVEARQDNNTSYRAFVKDFLYRLTLGDQDEASIGADEMYNELLTEIGAYRGMKVAHDIRTRMRNALPIAALIEDLIVIVKKAQEINLKYMPLANTPDYMGEMIALFDGPEHRDTIIRLMGYARNEKHRSGKPASIFMVGHDGDGVKVQSGYMSSSNPSYDLYLMHSFLEFSQAAARGVPIEYELGGLHLLSDKERRALPVLKVLRERMGSLKARLIREPDMSQSRSMIDRDDALAWIDDAIEKAATWRRKPVSPATPVA